MGALGIDREALGGGGGAGPLLPVACGRRLFPAVGIALNVLAVPSLCGGGGGGAGPRLGGGAGTGADE